MKRRIKRIPEKTCPLCAKKVNRRKGGQRCPYCYARLYSYRVGRGKGSYTIWVTDEARIMQIALLTLSLIREHVPHMHDFDFLDWKREAGAAHTLLDFCEGNQTLAVMLVGAFFNKKTRHACGVRGNLPRSVCAMANLRSEHLPVLLAYVKEETSYVRKDVKEVRLEARQVESF